MLHYYHSRTKRLLQYTSQKNNDTSFHSPHTLTSHLPSFFFTPTSSPSTQHVLLPTTCFLLRLLVSRFSSLLLGMSVSLMPMHLWLACIHYMHALYLVSTTYTLPYCTCTAHLVLRGSMHLLHTIHYTTALYLYSVLLGRARSAVVLQRLPNIRCLSCLLCTCSTSSRTGIRE